MGRSKGNAMNGLWTNNKRRSDFVLDAFRENCVSVSEVYIAVAFFTKEEIIEEIISNDCRVKMIVRLGYPTNPVALQKLMKKSKVEIRYYSASSFHPKLYIFGHQLALIGSANLTDAALLTNQEIIASIESEDPRFDDLVSLFNCYWSEARVLTQDHLNKWAEINQQNYSAIYGIREMDRKLQEEVGKVEFSNIDRGKSTQPRESAFIDSYRRKYQEWVNAFNEIREIYTSVGQRKNNAATIPMRMEIDGFINYIRGTHAQGGEWKRPSIGWNNERKETLLSHIHEWLEVKWPYYDIICNEKYPLISATFESLETIKFAEYREILNALTVLHSLEERQRYFPGGLNTLLETFSSENDLDRVKDSFSYLLFGEDDAEVRMANLIYNPDYKLSNFGLSNVQELIGWINNDELPVVNSRTTKIFRFYGFKIEQIGTEK